MSVETVREHLSRFGKGDSVVLLDGSSATVELAARSIGVEAARIAKTVSVYDEHGTSAVLIVAAGDARLGNGQFKRRFGYKPRMLRADDVERLTGHAPGGVCPFANPEGVDVWLDESLRRFDEIWPAAGDACSAVRVTPAELEKLSGARGWVDITTGWRPDGFVGPGRAG